MTAASSSEPTLYYRLTAEITRQIQLAEAASGDRWEAAEVSGVSVITSDGVVIARFIGTAEQAHATAVYTAAVSPQDMITRYGSDLERMELHRPQWGECIGPHGDLSDDVRYPCPEVERVARDYGVSIEGGYVVEHLHNGQIYRCHMLGDCAPPCPIHAPSRHPLAEQPIRWDSTRDLLMRQCKHLVWHTDPDDITIRTKLDSGYHQPCDGCCKRRKR